MTRPVPFISQTCSAHFFCFSVLWIGPSLFKFDDKWVVRYLSNTSQLTMNGTNNTLAVMPMQKQQVSLKRACKIVNSY